MSTATPDLSDFKPDTPDLSDFTPDSPVSSIAPPSLKQPVNVQPESVSGFINRVTGHPNYQAHIVTPEGMAIQAAKDVKNLSVLTPLQMLAKKVIGPRLLGEPPSAQQVTQSGVNVGQGMLLGGLEGEGRPPTPGITQTVNDSSLPQMATPPSSSISMLGKLAREAPVLGKYLRVSDLLKELSGAQDTPNVPRGLSPVPETNGVPWGTGGQGPVALRGKSITPALSTPRAYDLSQANPSAAVPLNIPQSKGGNPYVGSRIPATMEPAQSTTISLHGYHPESQTMMVQFKNGLVYEYRGVPPEVYNAYQNSESQGSFFANNIKGRYTTNRLGAVGKTRGVPRERR